jgi:O-Antigen ligase
VTASPPARFSKESAVAAAAALLLLLPWLFFSSPEYRAAGVLGFSILSLFAGWKIPAVVKARDDQKIRGVLLCLLVAYLASIAGGVIHGESPARALLLAISGAAGVLGAGVFAVVLLQPPWRNAVVRVAAIVTVMLVVASLLGFFVFFDWHVALGAKSPHADPQRIALVWPTRLFAASMGQEFWDHTNTAGYWFALAWVVTVEAAICRPRRAWAGWLLALVLGVAIFLTASRSAWVMVALGLPVLLVFRGWRTLTVTVALLAVSVGMGAAGLSYKLQRLEPLGDRDKASASADLMETQHVSGMVDRGSSGRLVAYQWLWDDLAGERLLGQGLAVTRGPMHRQLHEHSTYLATFRGGGFVALGAHLVILGIAGLAALKLARRGCRWPLVFAVAVFGGLLFDRSTVFRLTGFDEFPTHWLAVWIPLAMLLQPTRGGVDGVGDHPA